MERIYILINITIKFYERRSNKFAVSSGTKETRNEMAEFGNNLQVLAADEPQVIEEWNNISEENDSNFQSLLVGTTEKMALENFIDSNLHPRFVYFSDYKKIIGNVNLNEYNRDKTGPSIEFREEEFDKAETVDNLFYLAELDVDEASVRSALSRFKRRGILVSKSQNGVQGYALSAEARKTFELGDSRVLERRESPRDEGWVLVAFSIPEKNRALRYQLRSRLIRVGFAQVTGGLWIAPRQLTNDVTALSKSLNIERIIDIVNQPISTKFLMDQKLNLLLDQDIKEFNRVVFEYLKVTDYPLSRELDFQLVENDEVLVREDIFKKETSLNVSFVQDNHSRSARGVLRGLHFQKTKPQGKLVRVVRGEVYDVAVDIRKGSATFGEWEGVILSEDNKKQFWVPPGFAHGFVVLSDTADFEYKCTDYYDPSDEGSILWSDPDLNIPWPIANPVLSTKDESAKRLVDLRL